MNTESVPPKLLSQQRSRNQWLGRMALEMWPLVAIALVCLTYLILYPHRSDYAGHYIAGAGATALLLAAFAFVRRLFVLATVLTCSTAILLGALIEATIFRLATFDLVDFSAQSLGAVMACLACFNATSRRASAWPVLIFGFVGLAIGGYLALS